jgi:hypothetical protein
MVGQTFSTPATITLPSLGASLQAMGTVTEAVLPARTSNIAEPEQAVPPSVLVAVSAIL